MENQAPRTTHGGQITAVVFTAIIFLGATFVMNKGNAEAPILKNDNVAQAAAAISQQQATTSPFDNIDILAKAVYVWDVNAEKVIYQKDADQTLPLASITKILTADTAIDVLSPDTTITINQDALDQDGDNGLFLGEKWSFKNLLNFTLAVSSNDGAEAIADAGGPSFIEDMNKKAASIGLTSSQFYNPTGLDTDATSSGAYSSASDVAKLFDYTLKNHPEVFEATRYASLTITSEDNIAHKAVNTDTIINQIPGIIGSKTGYTVLAGGNLAVVYDAGVNHPIIIVLMDSTYDGRFDDMLKLVTATNKALSLQND